MTTSTLIFATVSSIAFGTHQQECIESYLTEIDESEINGISQFTRNTWSNGVTGEVYTSMLMGDGNIYDQFMVLHPPGTGNKTGYVVFPLHGEYELFLAVLGLAGYGEQHCLDGFGQVSYADGIEFSIYLDDVLIHQSERLKYGEQFENIALDVTNGNLLKIEVDAGVAHWCDHATVANPLLRCARDACEWELVYEHGSNGEHIYGSIAELTDDVLNGKDLRIVFYGHGAGVRFVFTQPQRIWTRNNKVFIYDQGSISLGWNDQNDAAFDFPVYQSVFDTSGRISVWNDEEKIERVYQYSAQWFTKG